MISHRDDPDWPEDLVARPCSEPAAEWHGGALSRVISGGLQDPVSIARAGYHERWLAHAREPGNPLAMPRISVIVPVFDRARLAAECVASALAQTHPAVEVIVVDDGSRDELEEALRPFGDRIQLLRQPNRGVSAARNRGIAAATGEILHFLDSDNLLDPDACERWIRAFRCVPDAELCFGHPRRDGDQALLRSRAPRRSPDGGPACPTTDFLRVAARRYPFDVSGVALPRWTVLQSGGFDERLAVGEDARFWFQLALRGTKVIGLREPINTRRMLRDGLTARWAHVEHPERGAVTLLDLIDLLRMPGAWRHVESCIERMAHDERYAVIDRFEDPLLDELRAAVLREIAELGHGDRQAGPSPRPLLLSCRDAALRLERRGLASATGGRFHAPFLAALDAALAASAGPPRSASGCPSRR